ncbi:MAG: hypothetical protein GY895_05685 [Phycisphaera sp.]|nr:hypothetical protein [Phycisphaera sp.]
MPFIKGSVTYARFRLGGDAPARVDETVIAALKAGVLTPTLGVPIEVETGWTAGEHILDADFGFERCMFDGSLHAAMRMDSVRVPPEIKTAYMAQEQTALRRAGADQRGDDSGMPARPLGRTAKKEAKEAAERRWLEEVADGRYRSSKLVPILWDPSRGVLLAPATSDKVVDALRDLVQSTFGARLQAASAGGLALDLLAKRGETSTFDDAMPDALCPAPTPRTAELAAMVGDRPEVPWVQAGPEPKDFLGNLFLLWLWMHAERHEGVVDLPDGRAISFVVDRLIDMECAWGITGRQSLRGDAPGRSAEAAKALQQGKWPRKLGLLLSDGESEWTFDLQGDLFRVAGLKIPRPEERPGSEREAIEQRIDSTFILDGILVALYDSFLKERFSPGWNGRKSELREWIASKGGSAVPEAPVVEMTTG